MKMKFYNIDYQEVTKYLLKRYEVYSEIHMDFNAIENKIVIHKIRYENGKLIKGQSTSYDYDDFENITKMINNGQK